MSPTTLDLVLDGLMDRYRANVPDVGAIIRTMVGNGLIRTDRDIENDHIAFRTMGVPHLGITSLEQVFLHYGYQRRERFEFPTKKLAAYWYSPPQPVYPRIFISELRVGELSAASQVIIRAYTDEVKADPVKEINLDDAAAVTAFLHTPLWRTPSWGDYQHLLAESEYAAWVIYNRYYLNHYTIAIHNLTAPFNTLGEFNSFLEAGGFTLNDSGGKIKVSHDGKLLQSSTVAAVVEGRFSAGPLGSETHRISGSYVEFAERRVLDQFAGLAPDEIRREHRRDGFEAESADKIFESTYTDQTKKRRT